MGENNNEYPQLDYTLYHVSDQILKDPVSMHIPETREYGGGFYTFLNKQDAIDFAKKTGRHVINSYHFNIKRLQNTWITKLHQAILTTMFLNMEDLYITELEDPSVEVTRLQYDDYFVVPMLQDGMKELEQKWKICEMPIDQCVDLAKEMPFVQTLVLKTPKAIKRLEWLNAESV